MKTLLELVRTLGSVEWTSEREKHFAFDQFSHDGNRRSVIWEGEKLERNNQRQQQEQIQLQKRQPWRDLEKTSVIWRTAFKSNKKVFLARFHHTNSVWDASGNK